VEYAGHGGPVDAHDRRWAQGGSGCHAFNLPGEAGFTEKIPALQNPDDGFFALGGDDSEFDQALQDIKHSTCRIPLGKKNLVFAALQSHSTLADLFEKGPGIKWRRSSVCE
jgi:hypothetical protein